MWTSVLRGREAGLQLFGDGLILSEHSGILFTTYLLNFSTAIFLFLSFSNLGSSSPADFVHLQCLSPIGLDVASSSHMGQ